MVPQLKHSIRFGAVGVVVGAASLLFTAVVAVDAAGTSPPARAFSTMAYDPVAQKNVMFGGFSGGFALGTLTIDDTWAWNGTAWNQPATPTKPPARKGAAMAYDKSSKSMVLFGGDADCCTRLGDTWTRSSATKTWVQQTTPGPPARSDAMMAYDASTGTTVLFGGLGPPSNTLGDSLVKFGDTWTWDGTTWTLENPPVSPPARARGTMAYDPATRSVVLFGGEPMAGAGSDLADTWTWNGTGKTWTQQTPAVNPPARHWAAMASHRATSTLVLFGGRAGGSSTRLNDTWLWRGPTGTEPGTWTQAAPLNSPPPREGPAMAGHVATGVVVLFGGSDGALKQDTWIWNGTNWKQRLT